MSADVSIIHEESAGQSDSRQATVAAQARVPAEALDLAGWISDWVAAKLGLAPGSIEHDKPLIDYGMDSTLAVDLAGRLEKLLGRPISPSIAWDFPTIAEITALLAGRGAVPGPVHVE
jgi:acyl carrier protein